MKRTCECTRNIILFCLSIVFLSGILSTKIDAAEKNEKAIRVGYPIQDGLTMKDKDGNLSGYSYDYLMEISQYTGWNYEFVFIDGTIDEQLIELMKMLEEGDIDLLGGMYYDESLTNVYSYPGYCYGINYAGLFVREESKLRESSLYNHKNIKVGVHNKRMLRNDMLDQYAQMNNIDIEQIITDSSDEYYSMFDDKKVDALLSTDITMAGYKNMFAVAHFSPKAFYFITTKGNTDIVRKLDYSISTIDQVNPDFMVQLYKSYFSETSSELLLTYDERNYLNDCGPLEVVMYDNKPPFQYMDNENGKPAGIVVEILSLIAEKVGIQLHYNMVSTYEDYISLIQSSEIDIGADALINYQDAKDTESLLTLPWGELPISVMLRKENNNDEKGKAAVPYYLKNVVGKIDNIQYYDSVEESLAAVQEGAADYCFIGDYCSQYFSYNDKFKNLKKLANSNIPIQKLCFGIANDNLNLLMIFNKAISSLSKETLNEIIYRNTYRRAPETLAAYLIKNRNLLIIVALASFLVFLIIWFYSKEHQRHRITFENKRYNAISSIVNDYFYEYNTKEDELILSDKCANYFQCEHKIQKFSKQLSDISGDKATGIWQIGEYIINNLEGSVELSCDMPDHTMQWLEVFSSTIQNRKKQTHVVGKITNIQEMKTKQIHLEQQATIDNLTGIYNIVTVKKLINKSLEEFDSTVSCALIISDIDHFKKINDTYGHHKGDEVLTEAAGLMKAIFQGDLAGRLGGDEFIVFIQNTAKSELESKCNQLCNSIKKKTQEMLGEPFSCSIGITWVEEGKSYDTLYQEADAALYVTKGKGKDGFSIFSDPT